MPRTGNASDWQHRLAAQRQEAEQLARERRATPSNPGSPRRDAGTRDPGPGTR
jgi:hypothetical protein